MNATRIRGVSPPMLLAAALLCAGTASAESATPSGDVPGGLGFDPTLTLDPTLPQVGALPGGVTPAFGVKPLSEGEWRFDFHGFLTAPLTAGINTRQDPQAGQSKTVLHAPPVV